MLIESDQDGAYYSDLGEEADTEGAVQWDRIVRTDSVCGPAAMVVAYIPHRLDLPPGGWRDLNLARQLGAYCLFRLGNPAPGSDPFCAAPSGLREGPTACPQGKALLRDFRATKEFRACAWIWNPTLTRVGGTTVVRWQHATEIGFTPPFRSVPGVPGLGRFRRGEGGLGARGSGGGARDDIGIAFKSVGVEITLELKFRITEAWANAGNAVLYGGRAPFMWLRLRYELPLVGQARVSCQGTAIPTLRLQKGGEIASELSMEHDVGAADIVRSMTGGVDQPPRWNERVITL